MDGIERLTVALNGAAQALDGPAGPLGLSDTEPDSEIGFPETTPSLDRKG
jgi:hypothetical protein